MTDSTKPVTFTASLGELRTRADPQYLGGDRQLRERFTNSRYEIVRLGDICESVQYGTSQLASTEQVGVPVIRMNNLQADGWDLGDLKYVDLSVSDFLRYALSIGDILVNRTNGSRELVGKSEVFREEGSWVFASYLIRLRLNESVADPEYVSAFLNTDAGRAQVLRSSRQILMSNINSKELRALEIPLPPLEVQHELVKRIRGAWRDRVDKVEGARFKLAHTQVQLADALGLPSSVPREEQLTWSVALTQLVVDGRFDPQANHPDRRRAIEAIHDGATKFGVRKLRDVVNAIRHRANDQTVSRFVGLGNVEQQTGELTPGGNTEDGSSPEGIEFVQGDVLYSRLRPRLNKVLYAQSDGYCSPEFVVLRVKDTGYLDPRYLAAVLRIELVREQLICLAAGNTLPRVSPDDVLSTLVPVPGKKTQEEIVGRLDAVREEARALRLSASSIWASAKNDLETSVLGLKGG